jgi:ABC-type antimicrobial peptide transport system permease subunit
MAVLSELRREALILALLGILLGLPVTQLPQLQQALRIPVFFGNFFWEKHMGELGNQGDLLE